MKLKFLAIALFPLTLAACQSSDMQKVGDLAVSMVQQQNADKTLAAYQWSYQPQGTDKPLVLNFNDQQRLSIATGCNTQGTSWKIEKGQIVTADLMSTMMACSPELMKQEQFSSSLFAKQTIPFVLNIQDVNKPTLTLIDATGQKIVFEGKMTPETQYQTQAETIFLEISPETKKCTGVAPQTCLQVREIKYAENGVKTQVDKDWTLFYNHIEGFEHNPNERQIIRVKRYEIKNPAADQSKYAYVHDMTIERATVK
ncbi:META domain protein [compost metagenome]